MESGNLQASTETLQNSEGIRPPELEIIVSPESGYSSFDGGASLEKAQSAFASLGDAIENSMMPLWKRLKNSEISPNELEIKMDLAFKGEAKWVVISAGGQATVSVKAVWKK